MPQVARPGGYPAPGLAKLNSFASRPRGLREGGAREVNVASGAGRHTHNFSIHSPSITNVQLEAVMGWTRLCSAGSTACSGPSVAAKAATEAARSVVSSGPQCPPAMLGSERRSSAGDVDRGNHGA